MDVSRLLKGKASHKINSLQTSMDVHGFPWIEELERVTGIEPAYEAWEAAVLPLNYTRSGVMHVRRMVTRTIAVRNYSVAVRNYSVRLFRLRRRECMPAWAINSTREYPGGAGNFLDILGRNGAAKPLQSDPMTTIDSTKASNLLPIEPPQSSSPVPGDADAASVHANAHIRSFVHRRGHITQGQREALETLLDKWSLAYSKHPLQTAAVFGRRAPLVLEIGFGMGETTEKIAQCRPDDDFLGVEVFNAGVGSLLRRIEESELSNIRIVQHDAVEVVRDMIAPDSLAGVHIYFPDPWPKKRHHKRRLIQSPFIALLASRIAPGGYLHCATDWEHYAHQMLEVLGEQPALKNTADGFAPRPDFRPQTKFETRGLRLGHGVWDLMFTREA
jgi:tRNA (guanine-N7-)-methyltransferase